jgi:hypothetical protein
LSYIRTQLLTGFQANFPRKAFVNKDLETNVELGRGVADNFGSEGRGVAAAR